MFKGLLNVDWLAFSVELTGADANEPTICIPPGYRMEVYPGNNIYKHRAIIFTLNGDKCLTLLWQPYSRLIKANLMLVEVANEWLYDKDWTELLDVLEEVHEYKFANLSRIDYCVDFNPTKEQMALIKEMANNKVYVQGYKAGSGFWHRVQDQSASFGRVNHCISWGSKTSSIKWKLYDKTFELTEWAGGRLTFKKPYIVAAWKENGMRPDNVWRLEVSLTNASSFKTKGGSVPDLSWAGDALQMEDIFLGLYNKRFIHRRNEGHADRRNDKREDILGLAESKLYITIRRKRYEPTERPAEIEQYRLLLRSLESTIARCSEKAFKALSNAFIDYEAATNMYGYSMRLLGMYAKDYCLMLWQKQGEGIVEYGEPNKRVLD